MKRILVTGVSGTGKTTLSRELKRMGYAAYDIENIKGLYTLVDRKTRNPVLNHDNQDVEKVRRVDWFCDIRKIQKLIASEKSELSFYCGFAHNLHEISPFFDRIFMLSASKKTIYKRLATRTSSDFGRNKDVRNLILRSKSKEEKKLRQLGAVPVRTTGDVRQTARTVVKKAKRRSL